MGTLAAVLPRVSEGLRELLVLDASFVSKSGGGTWGTSWFRVGMARAVRWELEVMLLAAGDVKEGRAYECNEALRWWEARCWIPLPYAPPSPSPPAVRTVSGGSNAMEFRRTTTPSARQSPATGRMRGKDRDGEMARL